MADTPYFPATAMPDDDWWHTLWPDPERVLRQTGLLPGMCVIDLCCGNGHFTAPLAQMLGQGGRVIAMDMDPEMLAQAKDRMVQTVDADSSATCDWHEGDACGVDKELEGEEKADALIIANTFHGVPDQTGLCRSIRKVLKAGGLFIIINWHARPREETPVLEKPRGPKTEMRLSPERLKEIVEPAGFRHKNVVELPPYHYAAVFHIA